MQANFEANKHPGDDQGPKYVLDIEGKEVPWNYPTITTEQIAELGGWTMGDGVIEIDKENNERTLSPGESVELKPGQGFAKKVKWRRGDSLYGDRIEAELAVLRSHFGEVKYVPGWICIENYEVPEGWGPRQMPVAFQVPIGYPGTPPYGFYVPTGLRFNGLVPSSYQDAAANRPPFAGEWGMFSWAHDEGAWRPNADIHSGTNLLNFAIGVAQRLKEGV